MKEEREDEE